jgi:hypothetical protein
LFAHNTLQDVAGELQLASVKVVFLSLFVFVLGVGEVDRSAITRYHFVCEVARWQTSLNFPVTANPLQSVAISADR